MQQNDIKHHFSTDYHPQSNGIIERCHRTLQSALISKGGDWERTLPWVLLYLRSSVKEDLKYAPAELLFGELPKLPGAIYPSEEFVIDPNIFGQLFTETRFPEAELPRHHIKNRPFDKCTHAFIRRDGVIPSLQSKYAGPYKIIEKLDRAFKLLVNNKIKTVTLERLKPAYFWQEPNAVAIDHNYSTHVNDPNTVPVPPTYSDHAYA